MSTSPLFIQKDTVSRYGEFTGTRKKDMSKHTYGRLEIICGGMFSGKTEELIRRVRRAIIAKQKVQVFKPAIDDRYHVEKVASHSGTDFEATPVNTAREILSHLKPDTTVVAIDEVQFLDDAVIDVCEKLADEGKRVICAGLDLDFRGRPFGAMPQLLARAEEVQKLHAICMVSGEEASRTQRLIDGKPAAEDDPIVLVGADEVYEARSRHYHKVLPSRQPKETRDDLHPNVDYVLIDEERLQERVQQIAQQIESDYHHVDELLLICVLKGGYVFLSDLSRALNKKHALEFMAVSSYGAGTESSGEVRLVMDLKTPLAGKHVILVEDIIDSGRTLAYLRKLFLSRNPASLRICTILNKPSRRQAEVQVEYVGFDIPDEFVVGYGLDFDEEYRNLPYVAVLKPSVFAHLLA